MSRNNLHLVLAVLAVIVVPFGILRRLSAATAARDPA
jgi:hypothetical protein